MGSLMDHHTGNSISNMYDQIGVNRRAMILRDPVWTLLQESNYPETHAFGDPPAELTIC